LDTDGLEDNRAGKATSTQVGGLVELPSELQLNRLGEFFGNTPGSRALNWQQGCPT